MVADPISITPDIVAVAAERIAPLIRRTPVVESTLLNELVGAKVFCKAESLQRTGSFKMRGASNALASLDSDQRAAGVVTHSSGNHAQAISRAAALHDTRATIVMPADAPELKKAATRHWGASIVEFDRYTGSRMATVEKVLAEQGGALISPFDNAAVIAGQGTVALELVEQVPDLDMLVVCLGGGGLLAGCATVARASNPSMIIVGVEPDADDDHVRSRAAGERVELDQVAPTIADGQQTKAPGELTWPITNALTDSFVSVSDEEIVEAMRFLFLHHKLVVEPSGASALAAVMHRGLVEPGMRVGVTVSGGNIDPERFAELLAGSS